MNEFPIILESVDSVSFEIRATKSDMEDDETSDKPLDGLSTLIKDSTMPIAVIGIGFRGPADATDTNRLWQLMLEKREAWSPIPKARWNDKAFYHPDHARHGTINVEGGHFIVEDLSLFDAPFFNMTSDEAAAMDPQQRLLLEVTYEGLENAGIPLSAAMGTQTSCFVGSFCADYTDLLLRDPECVPMYQCTNAGQSRAMMANRISYFFDFKGPSVTVDTACSGSLVALHLACQSLRTGDASMAIAAGVNLILSHEFMSTMSMMRFLSPDGRCHTFDEKANGYARGEAIACLILKPLATALRDGDTIRAIIRGTGSNQDGRTPGITLPSGTAQEALIRDVYARSGLCPSETEVVEAHGTGTQAGDPVEIGAIARSFELGNHSDRVLRIGSIKTNVGHLEGASGVTGVIKAILMLENRMILPSGNFETANPHISWKDWNLKVPQVPEAWDTPGPHRVSVNSFGYGGSNAHVIVEDARGYLSERGFQRWIRSPSRTMQEQREDERPECSHSPRPRIFMISAFDELSCKLQVASLREYLEPKIKDVNDDFVGDLAHTLNEHRSTFMWKAVATGASIQELHTSLSNGLIIRYSARKPTVGFVFTGQGAQWAGMGKELLQMYPVFRESLSRIDGYLTRLSAPFHVSEEICRSPDDSQLNHPLLSQTICSALQIALIDLLASWNIYPNSVTGHSSGEIAAAYACQALSMEDAMTVAYFRGIAASQVLIAPRINGGMMAIGLSEEDMQNYLQRLTLGRAIVACINSPSSVTVSGDATAIEELTDILRDTSIFHRRLHVDVAYHSHHMEIVANEYFSSIEHISPQHPDHRIYMFSSVMGKEISPGEMGAQYWVSNLLGQVRFSEALRVLCFETDDRHKIAGLMASKRGKRPGAAQKPNVNCLLEIGPHSALSGPIKQIIQEDKKLRTAGITYLSLLTRKTDAVASTLRAVSTLVTMGYPLDFGSINFAKGVGNGVTQRPRLVVDLPPYKWNHTKSYWAEPRLSMNYRNREFPRTDLLGAPENMSCPFERRWRNYLRVSEIPWLQDHRIQSDVIFPAAGYIAMAVEAIMQVVKDFHLLSDFILQDVQIRTALMIPEATGVEIMTSLRDKNLAEEEDLWYEFHMYSVTGDNHWTEHCEGMIEAHIYTNSVDDGSFEDLDGLATASVPTNTEHISIVDVPQLYKKLHSIGLEYGPCFSNLTCVHATKIGVCFAEVTIPATRDVMPMNFEYPFLIHPCTLDSIFHAMFAALPVDAGLNHGPLIPVSIEGIKISVDIERSAGKILSVCTRVRPDMRKSIVASFAAGNASSGRSSKPKLSIQGLRCARLEIPSNQIGNTDNIPIAYGIEWKPDPNFISQENAGTLLSRDCTSQIDSSALQEEWNIYTATIIKNMIATLHEDAEGYHASLSAKRRDDLLTILDQYKQAHEYNSHTGSSRLNGQFVEIFTDLERLLSLISLNLPIIPQEDTEAFKELQSVTWSSYQNAGANHPIYHAAANYVGLIGHKKPDISVLEISDGAERPHNLILEQLDSRTDQHQRKIPICAKYTFACREDPKKDKEIAEAVHWKKVVSLKILDLDREIIDQGWTKETYDVIITPNFVYSTQFQKETLLRIKSLLKPSGYLVMFNTVQPVDNPLDMLLLTLLYRQPLSLTESNARSEGTVEQTLHEAGFEEECTYNDSLIICRPRYEPLSLERNMLIIREDDDQTSSELTEALVQRLPGKVAVSNAVDARPQGHICIVLSELKNSLFKALDANMFEKIKDTFLHSEGVLWITRGGTMHVTNPEGGLAVGFARTARSESGVKPIITLDLDPERPNFEESRVGILVNLVKTHFLQAGPPEQDTEYAERDGVVMIPRIVVQEGLNGELASMKEAFTLLQKPFHDPNFYLSVSKRETEKDNVHFTVNKQSSEVPDGQIRVKVFAFAISEDSQELDSISGAIGFGCSGEVYEVGPNLDGFSVGDRVACLAVGTAQNFYQDRVSSFQKIADGTLFEVAASLPLAYVPAFYIIHEVARLKCGDMILIHDAATWFGQALLEVCILNKCEILTIVSTEAERDMLTRTWQITPGQVLVEGKDDITRYFSTTKKSLPRAAITSARLNTKLFRTLCSVTEPFGHVVYLGTRGAGHSREAVFAGHLKNISFSGFNMSDLRPDKMTHICEIWATVMSLYNQGQLRGRSFYTVYNINNLAPAVRAVSSDNFVVVTAEAKDIVQVTAPKPSRPLFSHEASYLLVGGLGGIGREIASWMVAQGVRYLILVNRSGSSTEATRSTVQMLQNKGAEVIVQACDISNAEALGEMYRQVSQSLPPIRGVIQGSMILRDLHIEKMTAEDFTAVLRPKYAGTWNLHNHLPRDLDFFLMLSSIGGVIGNATQSAYAAGSAFMDSFAAYRNSLGLPAVSLDLGAVTSVGYLAENKELAEKMTKQGFHSTDIKTLLSLVQLAISQSSREPHSQIVTGLGEWKPRKSLPNFDAPLFSHFRRRFLIEDLHEDVDGSETIHDSLKASKTRDDGILVVFEALSERIAVQLGISTDRINPGSALSEFGIDSTDAVDLRNWISKTMETTVPILEILASGSIFHLSKAIVDRSPLLNVNGNAP